MFRQIHAILTRTPRAQLLEDAIGLAAIVTLILVGLSLPGMP